MAQVTEEWVARYNGPSSLADRASVVATDVNGNVYVTGESAGSGTGKDYATVKYDSNGNLLWVARYNGPGSGDDIPTALAADAVGNVYVTGESAGSGTGQDYATVKYDQTGNLLWVARYNGPGNDFDRAYALAVDAAGNVYLTGESSGGFSALGDYATIKYDTNGNQLWVARYNGPGSFPSDRAYALAVDAGGNVYVTGTSATPPLGETLPRSSTMQMAMRFGLPATQGPATSGVILIARTLWLSTLSETSILPERVVVLGASVTMPRSSMIPMEISSG